MANLGISFDPTTIEPDAGRDLLPEGEYTLHVVESDVVPTKNGSGLILKLTYEVCVGAFEKRRIWDNINIQNASAQAQQIGQKQLSALCHAIGFLHALEDSELLHYCPFRAKVGIEKGKPKQDGSGMFPDRNKVTRYIPQGETAPPANKPAVQAAAAAPQPPRPAAPVANTPANPPPATRPAANGSRRPWDRAPA